MGRKSRDVAQQLSGLAFAGDFVLILTMLWLAFEIRFHTPLGFFEPQGIPNLFDYSGYIFLASGLYLGLLVHGDIYDSRNLFRFGLIVTRIVRSSLIWLAVVLISTFILRFEPPVSRLFFVSAWTLIPVGLIGWRSLFYSLITQSSLIDASRQRIVFVGWSEQTVLLTDNLRQDPDSPYQIDGFFETSGGAVPRRTAIPYLGRIEDFEDYLSAAPVDVVLLSAFDLDNQQIARVASICERELAELKLVPNYYRNLHFQNLARGFDLESIGGIPMMGGGQLPLDRVTNRMIKRAMDLFGAAFCFVLSAPCLFLFGGLIFMISPGPIFSRERRFGRNGKPFDLVKLRTERLNAPRSGEVRLPILNFDFRLGHFMRRWNIDDLPQLWNVLAGDMSLVGPRPESPDLMAILKHEIAQYNARLSVKPGITGWAQVNGLRGNIKRRQESTSHDLWYVQNWSYLLDLKIFLLTAVNLSNAE